jgi:hypothetical protein
MPFQPVRERGTHKAWGALSAVQVGSGPWRLLVRYVVDGPMTDKQMQAALYCSQRHVQGPRHELEVGGWIVRILSPLRYHVYGLTPAGLKGAVLLLA